jgi:hypothetical protein
MQGCAHECRISRAKALPFVGPSAGAVQHQRQIYQQSYRRQGNTAEASPPRHRSIASVFDRSELISTILIVGCDCGNHMERSLDTEVRLSSRLIGSIVASIGDKVPAPGYSQIPHGSYRSKFQCRRSARLAVGVRGLLVAQGRQRVLKN